MVKVYGMKLVAASLGMFVMMSPCFFAGSVFAADSAVPSESPLFEQMKTDPLQRPSVLDVENAISELSPPVDSYQLDLIRLAIMKQEPEDKERLQAALDVKLNDIADPQEQLAEVSGELGLTGEPLQEAEFSPEDIRIRIAMLNLGPDATVDDLRQKSELVGQISGITDPDARRGLIQYLENREKEAESIKQF